MRLPPRFFTVFMASLLFLVASPLAAQSVSPVTKWEKIDLLYSLSKNPSVQKDAFETGKTYLKDPDATVQKFAAFLLCQLNDPQPVQPLLIEAEKKAVSVSEKRFLSTLSRQLTAKIQKITNPPIPPHNEIRDRNIEFWKTQLASGTSDSKLQAIKSLGYSSEKTAALVPTLISMVTPSFNGTERLAVIRTLARIDSPAAFSYLTTTYQTASDQETKLLMLEGIRNIPNPDKQVAHFLTEVVLSEKTGPVERYAAGSQLESNGWFLDLMGTKMITTLIQSTHNPSFNIRVYSLSALGNLCQKSLFVKEAVPAMRILALQDPHPRVRTAAIQSLGLLGAIDQTIVPTLVQALQDPTASVRVQAILSLGYLETDAIEAIPALTSLMGSPEVYQFSRPAPSKIPASPGIKIQTYAIKSLAQIGKAAGPILLAALENPTYQDAKETLFQSVTTMGVFSDQVMPTLIRVFSNSEAVFREKNASWLCTMGPSANAAIPAILIGTNLEAQSILRLGPPLQSDLPVLLNYLARADKMKQVTIITVLLISKDLPDLEREKLKNQLGKWYMTDALDPEFRFSSMKVFLTYFEPNTLQIKKIFQELAGPNPTLQRLASLLVVSLPSIPKNKIATLYSALQSNSVGTFAKTQLAIALVKAGEPQDKVATIFKPLTNEHDFRYFLSESSKILH